MSTTFTKTIPKMPSGSEERLFFNNGGNMSKPTYEVQKRYDDAHTVQVKMKLNRKTDADIIEYLESTGNKQGAIKEAIRAQITKSRG
jgi:hypothetical protein